MAKVPESELENACVVVNKETAYITATLLQLQLRSFLLMIMMHTPVQCPRPDTAHNPHSHFLGSLEVGKHSDEGIERDNTSMLNVTDVARDFWRHILRKA